MQILRFWANLHFERFFSKYEICYNLPFLRLKGSGENGLFARLRFFWGLYI